MYPAASPRDLLTLQKLFLVNKTKHHTSQICSHRNNVSVIIFLLNQKAPLKNADPDPGQTLPIQKVRFLHEKILCVPRVICQKPYPTKRSKAIFNGWKSGSFVNFSQFPYSLLLDPDPHSQNGSGSRRANSIRIRIRNTACPQVFNLSARSQELRPRAWISIVDPWHFGTDPGIRTTDLTVRILLFSSVTFKMPTKFNFFYVFCLLPYFLKVHLHYSSKIKSHKEVTKQ